MDISLLLRPQDEDENAKSAISVTPTQGSQTEGSINVLTERSKWSTEDLVVKLRESGMKWENISKRIPGRSAIGCRLYYHQNLARRSQWDEDRKNELARLYER